MSDYQLSLLKIPVTDIKRSTDFYRDALGFEPQFVAEEYGWAQLQAGELPLALYKPGMGGGNAKVGGSVGFHLSLPESQFDRIAAELLGRGILDENKIHTSDDGSTFIDVRDPDGNMVHIGRQTMDKEA